MYSSDSIRSQARWRSLALDSLPCAALVMIAVAVYARMFLKVPVLVEVRDFLLRYGQQAKLWHVWVPNGGDYRPFSWKFFAWQQWLFEFDAEALNLVQFVLLGLCAMVGYIHLRQLVGSRAAAFAASALWLLSLPVAHAAFWQATQHDKLAFLFTMVALIVSFYGIRADRIALLPGLAFLILVLVALAIASKPIAYIIPGALLAQVILFTPRKIGSGYLRSIILILLPAGYGLVYSILYLLKMDPQWQGHAMGGDIGRNLHNYIRYVTNIDYDGSLWPAVLLFMPVAIAWMYGFYRFGNTAYKALGSPNDQRAASPVGGDFVQVYFCAIFLGSIAILAGAKYPTQFYVLLPMFAFTASLATLTSSLFATGNVLNRRCAAVLMTVLVVGLFTNYWANVAGQSRLGHLGRSARNLAHGYNELRHSVDPSHLESITFFFPRQPFGYYYFLSRGKDKDIDPTIPSFVFRRALPVPIRNRFGEVPSHDSLSKEPPSKLGGI